MLGLVGRYYRTVPVTEPGYVYEDLELEPSATALVAMHCWNIGCGDGPPIDPDYWVGMGFPVAHREAARIMRERIRPAMDAAREAGVLVCHVESEAIRQNRERGPTDVEDENGEPRGWRETIAWRSHGRHYPSRSPLSRMDRAKIVSPVGEEPFVCRTEELDSVLAERKVENLVYCGFATDMCVLRAPGGVEPMASKDYHLYLLRDATLGVECPDTFDERVATRWGIRYFETHFGDTIATDDFIAACLAVDD
jgi:nicotinamidase-related amidase